MKLIARVYKYNNPRVYKYNNLRGTRFVRDGTPRDEISGAGIYIVNDGIVHPTEEMRESYPELLDSVKDLYTHP